MSISNDDAAEIIQRMRLASWPSCGDRALSLKDAELVVWNQTEGQIIPQSIEKIDALR